MTGDALLQTIEAAPKPGRTELALAPEALAYVASLPELDRMRLKQRMKAAGVIVSDWWRAVEVIVRVRRSSNAPDVPDWQRELTRGENGAPLATARNLGLVLRNWERMQTLCLNQLTLEAELEGVPITGGGEFRLRESIEEEFKLVTGPELIKAGTAARAEEKPFHPIRDYLDGLKWDFKFRLNQVHTKLLGAPDNPLYARMVTMWMISMVARMYAPGCQADACLVLYSPKGGVGKSTWFDALTSYRGWATRGNVDPSDKDSLLRAHRVWLQVLDELDELTRKQEWSAIKRWMTEFCDIFRAPYAPRPQTFPRQFVFGGTTNKTEYMPSESAAARRFWTIPCGEINLELTAQLADQLIAEAKYLYMLGTKNNTIVPPRDSYLWWPTAAEGEAIIALAGDHQPAPIWRDRIEAWLDARMPGLPPVTSVDVMSGPAMDLEKHQYGAFQHAVGEAMRSLGYVSKNVTTDGKQRKAWVKP